MRLRAGNWDLFALRHLGNDSLRSFDGDQQTTESCVRRSDRLALIE